ncbi:MAG TPA: isopentenyl-diphosphate Delta-isomerase, partial [Nocardioidaceae bacterium]|nr:isopentenyl-diphosphate Delta-isomerase [Nocardioidaceae bacterium]
LVLPGFRYRAEANGVVENEMCPVFTAVSDDLPRPDPVEVDSVRSRPWDEVVSDVLDGRAELSPWCTDQVRRLTALGPRPGDWPDGDPALLPPAARRSS